MTSVDYSRAMYEAIKAAQNGCFKTYPNPAVGAVLVKDGEIAATGWHKKAGMPHAEIECLENAKARGIDTKGCTLVVTLEPCNHYGKTAPCTDAIIAAGIKKLVYGASETSPLAQGGAEKLKEAGIEIEGGVLEQQCIDLIADFRLQQNDLRPYVILKLASTLDGRIATRTGHSKWISSRASREEVHKLRFDIANHGGAILIGGGTFRADNPRLSARAGEGEMHPLACILTSRLPKADADFYLLNESPEQTVFFASPAASASTTAEALRKKGCRIFAIGPGSQGGPDFALMFKIIRQELKCPYVLCEGGGKLALSLLEAGFIDEFHLYLSPIILGDNEAKSLFAGFSPLTIDEALRMRFCGCSQINNDARLILRPETISL